MFFFFKVIMIFFMFIFKKYVVFFFNVLVFGWSFNNLFLLGMKKLIFFSIFIGIWWIAVGFKIIGIFECWVIL